MNPATDSAAALSAARRRTGTRRPAVAILTDIFGNGGVERVVSYMSLSLFSDNDGMIILFDDARIDFDYRGSIVSLNIPPPPYRSLHEESRALAHALWRLIRVKRRQRIDVCISHKEGPNFINILSNFSKRIVVVHEHKSSGMKHAGITGKLVRHLISALYNRADTVVAVSEMIARDLVLNFGISEEKIRVIRNPCDVEAIHRLRKEPLDSPHSRTFDHPVVITMGRLVQQKAQWHLIRAFSNVKSKVPDARLVIIGEGDESRYLNKLVCDLDLLDSVHLMGFHKNPFKFIHRAKVFALTSVWEGFPLVLLEAMACGVPIVASDSASGLKELLAPDLPLDALCTGITHEKFGVLTPPIDGEYRSAAEPLTNAEQCLATAIIEVLQSQQLQDQYNTRGTERVSAFGMDAYASEWSALLHSVAGSAAAGRRVISM